MRAERFSDWLHRRRYLLFAVWLVHVFLLHYFVIGLISWDGFAHRSAPIVELFQHGSMGKDKYFEWSLIGYTPFIELVHIPFLYLFRMTGFLIGFPLVVFPLCTAAVFLLIRELTGDRRAATYGALAYIAIPMINQQPFSCYIDFAVSGLLAFFVYALLRVRASERRGWPYVRLAIATVLFTMSRVQAVYVVVVMTPLLGYALFCTRERFRIRIEHRRKLVLALIAIAAAALPAIALQIYKYYEFGSPTYPVQFKMFGLSLGSGGISRDYYFQLAGLGGDDWGSIAKGFFEGWIWHPDWPIGGFYSSRYMAAGLLFILALALAPVFVRTSNRLERWVIGAGVLVSLLSRDLAVPRWSYTIVLALAIVLGRSLAELARSRRGAPAFWIAISIVLVHLLRPELDMLQLRESGFSPRMNVTGSSLFEVAPKPSYDVEVFPDLHAKLVIIELTSSNFLLQLYGRRLTNEVVDTIPGDEIGPGCRDLAPYLARDERTWFVDDRDFTKDCVRDCAITGEIGCRAWRIKPAP